MVLLLLANKLTSGDEHESFFSLRYHGRPRHSIHVLEELRLPVTSSTSRHTRKRLRPPKGTWCVVRGEPPNTFLSAPKLLPGVDLLGYEDSRQFLTVAEFLKVLKRSPICMECHFDSHPYGQSADSTRSWNTEHLYTTLIRWAAVSHFDSVTA